MGKGKGNTGIVSWLVEVKINLLRTGKDITWQ